MQKNRNKMMEKKSLHNGKYSCTDNLLEQEIGEEKKILFIKDILLSFISITYVL